VINEVKEETQKVVSDLKEYMDKQLKENLNKWINKIKTTMQDMKDF
jgi:hypothetical protein